VIGISEPVLIPTAAAIANAVANVGVRRQLPITRLAFSKPSALKDITPAPATAFDDSVIQPFNGII
jgi:hypothetical protein